MHRRSAIVFFSLALVVINAGVASADDGDPRFRRTTSRAALDTVEGALVIGIPEGEPGASRATCDRSRLRARPSSFAWA